MGEWNYMMGQTKQRCTHTKTKRYQGTASHQVHWHIRHTTSRTSHTFLPKLPLWHRWLCFYRNSKTLERAHSYSQIKSTPTSNPSQFSLLPQPNPHSQLQPHPQPDQSTQPEKCYIGTGPATTPTTTSFTCSLNLSVTSGVGVVSCCFLIVLVTVST